MGIYTEQVFWMIAKISYAYVGLIVRKIVTYFAIYVMVMI